MKKNSAYTVAELMVVFVFIGAIMIIGLHTLNNRQIDYFGRYYTVFDALTRSVYNTSIDTSCRVDGTACDAENGGRQFPTKPNGKMVKMTDEEGKQVDVPENNLCSRLTEYLNFVEPSSCIITNESDLENKLIKDLTNKDEFDKQFDEAHMQFATTNGFLIYFSELKSITVNHGGTTPREIKYFIVYVDLNGTSKPNTALPPHPDIVPFVVTTDGVVIPVGHPIYDNTYMTAKVVTSGNDINQTISLPLDEARRMAFGETIYTDIPLTMIRVFEDTSSNNNNISYFPKVLKINGEDPKRDEIRNKNVQLKAEYSCDDRGGMGCNIKIDANMFSRQ